MAKPIKNYIVLVDSHRRASRRRNTAGRYKVGAKAPKEAEEILRNLIGFGDIKTYYEITSDCKNTDGPFVDYKQAVKIEVGTGKHLSVIHATNTDNWKNSQGGGYCGYFFIDVDNPMEIDDGCNRYNLK